MEKYEQTLWIGYFGPPIFLNYIKHSPAKDMFEGLEVGFECLSTSFQQPALTSLGESVNGIDIQIQCYFIEQICQQIISFTVSDIKSTTRFFSDIHG